MTFCILFLEALCFLVILVPALHVVALAVRKSDTASIIGGLLLFAFSSWLVALAWPALIHYDPAKSGGWLPFMCGCLGVSIIALRNALGFGPKDPSSGNIALVRDLLGERAAKRVEVAVKRMAQRREIAESMGISVHDVMKAEKRGEIDLDRDAANNAAR